MNLVNGVQSDCVHVRDRGLAYGDGVFRTFTMRNRRVSCWVRQYAKLATDCAFLRLQCPGKHDFESDLAHLAKHLEDCVVKLIVTRGTGARGYAPPHSAEANRITTASELPRYPDVYYRSGVRAHLCELRLARQPALAGIKHLNRLEQVLARAEWTDPSVPEGILRDDRGHVICGTMSNIFLFERERLVTPALGECGVAGVQRERVIDAAREHGIDCDVGDVDLARLLAADEVFAVNSVIGVWQIAELGNKTWSRGTSTAQMRGWLANAEDA